MMPETFACFAYLCVFSSLFPTTESLDPVSVRSKTIQVSSTQLGKTSSAHGSMCPLPQAKYLSARFHRLYPPSPSPPFPSGCHHTVVCVYVLGTRFLPKPFIIFPKK